jgi:Domain of unknown function (DUF4915)/Glycosyl transferases group 1
MMRSTLHIGDPLFVSAPNNGGLFYVHRHLMIPLIKEDATGLTLIEDGLLWCVQTNDFNTIREVRQGALRSNVIAPQPLDLHDVMSGAGGVYAVCTEANEVIRLDETYRVVERWGFGGEPDSAHVNCIAWFEGRLLASMFGPFATHRGYKEKTRAAGRVIDVHRHVTLIEGLSQPHSLVVSGEELWLCNSEDRRVYIYDKTFTLVRQKALPGYTRGLAIGAECVYVGVSRSRNANEAHAGEFTSAVIAVLDRRSLDVIGYIPLPCNEIYDIRIATSPNMVTDVMALMWAHERAEYPKSIAVACQAVQEDADRHFKQVQLEADSHLMMVREELQQAQYDAVQRSQLELQYQADVAELEHKLFSAEQWREEEVRARQASDIAVEKLSAELIECKRDRAQHEASIQMLEGEIGQITASRYWRWTWPARAAMQLLRGRGLIGRWDRQLAGRARQQVRRFRGRARELARSEPATDVPRIGLVPPEIGKRDIFVWSLIDWDYRIQRPQHLARELAASGHRVFYLSNVFVDQEQAGFRAEPLDEHGRLFRIQLHLKGSPGIYYAVPDATAQQQLRDSLGQLLRWTRSRACLSLVQHSFWLETARLLPNHRLVYDCMDHHGGFLTHSPDVLAWEQQLMRTADLLVVTSDWLYEETGKYNSHRWMVRNACQYEHFATPSTSSFQDKQGRKIIGYYGAIADWIDLDLLEKMALHFDDHLLLMVGMDTAGARQRLRHLDNVQFVGEVPYATLPFYLASFDVCLLPFQVIPLTLATNPVKVYEYLCAGKEVVSIALPEIRQFGDLVRTAIDHAGFLQAVEAALESKPDPALIAARRAFAAGQTWTHRVKDLLRGVEALSQPRVHPGLSAQSGYL